MGTKPTPAEVVLHPQRLAIVRALAGDQLTTKQLAERVPEIPQATLYRHIAALLEVGAITVVSERKVRGTPERTYALGSNSVLGAEAFAHASPDDHFRFFTTFVAGMLDQFGRYLERPEIDLHADGVGYREVVVKVTEDEFRELIDRLRDLVREYEEKPLTPDRTARTLSTITIPLDRKAGADQ